MPGVPEQVSLEEPFNHLAILRSDRKFVKPSAERTERVIIGNDSLGKDKEANWLPAPKGKFVLVMRIYSPRKAPPSILDGTWTPPAVVR